MNKKILFVVLIILALLFILFGSIFALYRFSPETLNFIPGFSAMLKTVGSEGGSLATLGGVEPVFKIKKPVKIEGSTVSKLISAKAGGQLKLTDPMGTEVTFFVPPEALDKDTELQLSALSEIPIENYTSTLGNGVLVEPKGVKFKIPASVTFNFSPAKKEENQPSQSEEDVLGLTTTITPTSTPYNNRGIIIVGDNPEDSQVAPTTNSPDGKQSSAPANQTGSFVPDEITPAKGALWVNNAAQFIGSGGCTPAQLDALFTAYEKAGSVEDSQFARANIKKCLEDKLNDLEGKCKNNKMLLRRKDFDILILFLESRHMQDQRIKAEELRGICTAEYVIKGENSASINSGVMSYRVDAKVCGYLDDFWQGKEGGDITVPGTPAHHWVEDVTSFVLPPAGGTFFAKGGGGTYSAIIPGGVYSYSGNYTLATGYYNGFDRMILYGWGQVETPVTITITSNSCTETVPLAPVNPDANYNPYQR